MEIKRLPNETVTRTYTYIWLEIKGIKFRLDKLFHDLEEIEGYHCPHWAHHQNYAEEFIKIGLATKDARGSLYFKEECSELLEQVGRIAWEEPNDKSKT